MTQKFESGCEYQHFRSDLPAERQGNPLEVVGPDGTLSEKILYADIQRM